MKIHFFWAAFAVFTAAFVLPSSSWAAGMTAAQKDALMHNGCDFTYLEVLDTPAAMGYAKTGIWKGSGSKPPRARVLAAFGMKKELRSYLQSHPTLIGNADILSEAVFAGKPDVVAMLLGMGFDPNKPGKEASSAPPLLWAANCSRPTSMLYLLQAGANVYAASAEKGNGPAMAYALVGSGLDMKPFVEGVQLLLAAGFDPRCPVTIKGSTAPSLVRGWLRSPHLSSDQRKTDQKLLKLLTYSAKIAAARHPGRPHCGGLDWWPKTHAESGGTLAKPGG